MDYEATHLINALPSVLGEQKLTLASGTDQGITSVFPPPANLAKVYTLIVLGLTAAINQMFYVLELWVSEENV